MSSIDKIRTLDATGWTMLALGIVFSACLPVFLIAINVGYITDSDWLYTYNWWRNGVPDRTGFSVEELHSAADQIKDYFQNDAERLDVRVNTSRGAISLFEEREVLHMIDVKELFRLVADVSVWTGTILVLCAALGMAIRRSSFFAFMSRWLRWCALVWGIAIAIVVAIAIIDFTWDIHPVPLAEFHQRPMAAGPIPSLPALAFPRTILPRSDAVHRHPHSDRVLWSIRWKPTRRK